MGKRTILALVKFPFYLVWYAGAKPVLTTFAIPFMIVLYVILSAMVGLSWVWEKARYGNS